MSSSNPASVPDFWFRTMIEYPGLPDGLADEALHRMGMTRAAVNAGQVDVTQDDEAALIDHLAQLTGNDLIGIEIGLSHSPVRGSILHYIARSASTLDNLIELTTRYIPITRPLANVTLDRDADGAKMRFFNSNPRVSVHVHHTEFAVASVLKTFRALTGNKRLPARVRLANLRKNGHNKISDLMDCPVDLDAEKQHEIHLTHEMLALPLQTADSDLLTHLTSYGDMLLQQRHRGQPTLRQQVEEAILDRMSFGIPPLSDIAQALSLSERTLSRRLADNGDTYRHVVDDLRRMMAESYLSDPEIPLAEIAFLLGFTDQSSFGTAFRRWTGQTPGQVRAGMRENSPR